MEMGDGDRGREAKAKGQGPRGPRRPLRKAQGLFGLGVLRSCFLSLLQLVVGCWQLLVVGCWPLLALAPWPLALGGWGRLHLILVVSGPLWPFGFWSLVFFGAWLLACNPHSNATCNSGVFALCRKDAPPRYFALCVCAFCAFRFAAKLCALRFALCARPSS
jgi:hypothetical protein